MNQANRKSKAEGYQLIDENLDKVLKASGSALSFYTTPAMIDKMREAMRGIMSDSYAAGSSYSDEALAIHNTKKAEK